GSERSGRSFGRELLAVCVHGLWPSRWAGPASLLASWFRVSRGWDGIDLDRFTLPFRCGVVLVLIQAIEPLGGRSFAWLRISFRFPCRCGRGVGLVVVPVVDRDRGVSSRMLLGRSS